MDADLLTQDEGLSEQAQTRLKSLLLTKFLPFILAVFSFLFAWRVYGYFNLNFPIGYNSGDPFFTSWLIKRLIDGAWYFNSTYTGFPFVSTFLDYPSSDLGNLFVLKLLGLLTHDFVLTQNLYFLLGFSVTAAVSVLVLQKLGLTVINAIIGAVLFTFLPFHFLRLGHLFYTWYFHVPLLVWFAFQIFSSSPLFLGEKKGIWQQSKTSILLLLLTCFGVYFAFFSAIMFIASGIAGSLQWKSRKNIVSAFLAVIVMFTAVIINITPNLIFIYKNGRNPEVARRSAIESELYGLKLTQMLLPPPGHRYSFFAKINNKYQGFPLVNENSTSALGLIGALGLLILLAVAIGTPFFRFQIDSSIQLLAFITIFLFLCATIGGFSSIFSMLISPMIRAWNRVSVFIGFTSITAFLICTEKFLEKIININRLKSVSCAIGISLLVLGLLDQTNQASPDYIKLVKNQFLIDRHFIQKIEKIIPGGAVYQLPYMPFPEGAFLNDNKFLSYEHFRGYLHSKTLHWSFGGIRGRKGDLFFRQLSIQTPMQQLRVIKQLGFNGIYIDRRGYNDHGETVEREFVKILGKKALVSEDSNLAFFSI